MPLSFVLPSDITSIEWTLGAGTPVGDDYDVEALTDGDPSLPLWIAETSIDLRGDAGSAARQDVLVLTHHNFQEGTPLRYQMHSDTATWAGTTDVDVTVYVGPWVGRWAPHVAINLADLVPTESTRTKRYRRLTNTIANDVAIKIGELTTGGTISSLASAGMRLGARTPEAFGVSMNPSRVGVATVHDYRTRARNWVGRVTARNAGMVADVDTLRAWQHDVYGARPFVVWPMNDIAAEPIFGRFGSPVFDPTYLYEHIAEIPLVLEELSCGEAY